MAHIDDARLVSDIMARINRAWLDGHPAAMVPLLHPDIVLVAPDGGWEVGRDALVESYVDFCNHAKVEDYHESDHSVDVVGDAAVVAYRFEMTFERGHRFRSTGQDRWMFARSGGQWRAVWRTMRDLVDQRLEPLDD